MTIKYSFDSSAILGAWNRRLPPDVVPSFWEKLEALVQTGVVRCIDEVKAELAKKDDDALAWLKKQTGLVVQMTAPVFAATQSVLKAPNARQRG